MKKLIDEVYIERYKGIYDYTRKVIKHFRRKYDTEYVISESYIYVMNRSYKINITRDEIEGDIKKFIKNQIMWDRSILNNTKTLNDINKSEDIEHIEIHVDIYNTIWNENNIEELIEEYMNTLDRMERRLFEMYYFKGLDTKSKIQKHLQISSSSAGETNRDCKRIYEGLREFVKQKIK
jgi:hypothetical protein